MVFQKPNPFPKSIYDNIAFGPRVVGMKGDMDEIVESALQRAALWDEVKDRLKTNAFGMSGGQQQRLCIARALATSARRAADGRAVLGARPDLHRAHRGPDARAQAATTRSSSSRTTCSRPRACRTGRRSSRSTWPDDGHRIGEVVEFDDDRQDLLQPRRQAHRGLRDREVRLDGRAALRIHFQRGARRARGAGARRHRPRRRVARPRDRGVAPPGRRARRDGDRRRRPHRRPLPGGPPVDPVAARAAGAGRRRPARRSRRCCT